MQVTVKKWGNSASVRIPVSVMEAAHLTLDAVVDVREEDGRIIIEPVRQPDYDLDGLLAGITPDNLHGEVGFGPAEGKRSRVGRSAGGRGARRLRGRVAVRVRGRA